MNDQFDNDEGGSENARLKPAACSANEGKVICTMRVDKFCDLFIQRSVFRGAAAGTIQGYRDRLRLFLADFGNRKLKSLTLDELLEHFHRTGVGLAPDTQRTNIILVERVMKMAMNEGEIRRAWFKPGDIPKPKQGRRDKILTPEQTASLVNLLRPNARLIYRALRLTAARPGELCRAMVENLHGEPGNRVIILEKHKTARKTGKPRRILLTPAAEALVMEAVGARTEGPIFRTSRGNPWVRDRLSREFRRVRDLLKIDRRIVLYCSRHEGATLIVEAVGDITAAQIQLGHEDIGTTQRYVHVNEQVVREATAKSIRDVLPDNRSCLDKEPDGSRSSGERIAA